MASYPVDPSYTAPPAAPVKEDYATYGIVKAVQYGIYDRVLELVEPDERTPGAAPAYDVNCPDEEDVSLLHWAAINNRMDIARFLLSKGAIVDRLGGHLQATPLHWAIRQSHLSMIHLLMEHGADPSVRDNTGFACLHVAVQVGSIPVIAYLLARGVDIDSRDANHLTPLMIACIHGRSQDLFRILLTWGADTTLSDLRGNTATHYAVNFANFAAIMTLDKAGASWNVPNLEGKAAYEVRELSWFSERLRTMAAIQSFTSKNGHKTTPPKLRWSNLHYSPKWRFRVTVSIPPFILLLILFLLTWSTSDMLQFLLPGDRSAPQVSPWLNFLVKFIIFMGINFVCRRVLARFADPQLQMNLLFSLAATLTLLFTATYLFCVAPRISGHWLLHTLFTTFVTCLWVSFYACSMFNPGYIDASNRSDRQRSIIQLVDDAMKCWDTQRQPQPAFTPLERFCTTCLVQKPLRSKHCSTCDRCVARFDHHCPWIYNCVGTENHATFLIYILCTSISCGLFAIGCIVYWTQAFAQHLVGQSSSATDSSSWLTITTDCLMLHPLISFSFLTCVLFWFWTLLLFWTQLYQMVWINMTTNERMNIDRYVEFTGGLNFGHSSCTKNGTCNPYNRGIWRNMLDLLGLGGYAGPKRLDWRRVYHVDRISFPYCDNDKDDSEQTVQVRHRDKLPAFIA